jgi:hypothetical protein
LEPTPAKEIGQKLTETPAAQELVSRIKEVTRRRRVTAPAVAGDDVDPNTLAEYLDNLLPPDAVAQLESHCLESDVHLAEAAACHQILTLIGQPAGVNDAMRQKMYDLVHAIESIPAERRPVATSPRRSLPPSVFSQRPMLARILTGAAILLGVIGITWLVWISLPPRDAGGIGDHTVAGVDAEQRPAGHFIPTRRAPDAEEPIAPAMTPELDAVAADSTRESQAAADESSRAKEDRKGESTESSEEMPNVKAPPSETEAATPDVAKPSEPADTAASEPANVPVVPPAKPEVSAEKLPAVLATYVASSGVLLHADDSNRDWRRIRFRSEIHDSERVLCLPFQRAALQVPTGASVELVGETELTMLPPDDGVDVHAQLERGRIVLGTNQETASFQIDFLNQSWRFTLKAPEDVVGLALAPVWKPGGPFSYEATVVVPRGEVEFESSVEAHQLGGPVQLRWASSGGFREKESLSIPPAWLEREELTASEVRAAAALEDDLRFDSAIALALIDATTNERKELRLLGVQCLGAIGRLPAVIDAMNTMGRRDVRQSAIAALRRHIARGETQEEALRQALLVKFSKSQEHAQGVIDLLRGYSDAEFQQLQKKDYEDLIKLLTPDRDLLIRELAIMNLEDLAGKPLNSNYNPDKPKDSDIAAWQRALTDGRLPPRVRGKM